ISICEFIEIDNKYITSKIPKIEDIIAEMQEDEDEKESKKPVKSVTTIQAIAEVDLILDYIEQPNANIEINIKVFAELKQIRKELDYSILGLVYINKIG
ncbi:2111_t:CDS:2, partial [Cetraspora pellucida]